MRLNQRDQAATGRCYKVQINNLESYQAAPGAFDRKMPPSTDPERNERQAHYDQVPVLRVYGSLPTGHTLLVNIHGVFPYFYVQYEEGLAPSSLHRQLEAAIVRSLARGKKPEQHEKQQVRIEGATEDTTDVNLKYVAHVSVCKGVPFYGYHVGHELFYKIYLLNPAYQNRLADILRDGKMNGVHYDVYEAHIPYGLQFLADYNLFGCAWMSIDDLHLRIPVTYYEHQKTQELGDYLAGCRPTDIERSGFTALEADIGSQNIMNRLELKERNLHHDFSEKYEVRPQIYVQSTRDLWKDGVYQRDIKGAPQYSTPSSINRSYLTQWIETTENSEMFDHAKKQNAGAFINLEERNFNISQYPTAFESVTELFFEAEFEDNADIVRNAQNGANDNGAMNNDEFIDDDDDDDDELEEDNYNIDDNDNEEISDGYNGLIGTDSGMIDDKKVFDAFEEEENALKNRDFTKYTSTPDYEISDVQLTQKISEKFSLKRNYITAFRDQKLRQRSKYPFKSIGNRRFQYRAQAPLKIDFASVGLPQIEYADPYYLGKPPKPFIFGNKKFKLQSRDLEYLKRAEVCGESISLNLVKNLSPVNHKIQKWRFITSPPSYEEVQNYNYDIDHTKSQLHISQKFKLASSKVYQRRPDESNDLRLCICEIQVNTRKELNPNPLYDEVVAIFWKYVYGSDTEEGTFFLNVNQKIPGNNKFYCSELEMLQDFIQLIRDFDPDIISGYEVHASSWGYLIERSRLKYGYDFLRELSRVNYQNHSKFGDYWGYTHTSGIQISGRHVLNIWRTLRKLSLAKYSIEHVSFHLLHERVTHLSNQSLTELFKEDIFAVIDYYTKRLELDTRLIESQDLITNATEEARLIGIDFNDVYYRGSQYKVESFMIRIAKAENFILFSPSKKQVKHQKPLECIPLVMEPVSAFYKSPLIVLDFQSLYPSIMIAYNYCYSTLLGRLKNYSKTENTVGVVNLNHPPGLLKLLENDVNLSPNGLMFVKATVRKSLLAKMLEEILETRFMVKSTMSFLDENMKKLYYSRQLALKLIANVTYGYTSASFSGRMPCSDIADCIVQSGRETLEKAIELIENRSEWGAKVVYGDTDSLFVYLPGRSREDAFKLGKEMADVITKSNPEPVTLKFEKIYHPSVLLAKKRYVGYSYENPNSEAKFDAKGIETVRRDGHPAQQYIVENCLRKLFETANVSEIKSYVQDQFSKILNNKVSIQDFCFAKEVRIGTYKNLPPGAVVSEKKMAEDERAEPQYRERVPYVIIKKPGSILRERAVSPADFLKNDYELDSEYYITKTLVPPLERIFSIMGVDVKSWYQEMPKSTKKYSIYESICLSCRNKSRWKLCDKCKQNELQTVLNLRCRMKSVTDRLRHSLMVCRSHGNGTSLTKCESYDCPEYYTRQKEIKKIGELEDLKEILSGYGIL